MFPSFVQLSFLLMWFKKNNNSAFALISWLKNLHSATTLPHWKEKCDDNHFFQKKFWLLKTYHPVLDERRLKETALRIWNLPTGQMYLWMRCVIFLYVSISSWKNDNFTRIKNV